MCTHGRQYTCAHICKNRIGKQKQRTIAKQRLAPWQSSRDKERIVLHTLCSLLPNITNSPSRHRHSLRTKQYNHCEMKLKKQIIKGKTEGWDN